jgi:release factor glutamine methyltransferase
MTGTEPPRLIDLIGRSATYLAGKGLENARREAEWIFAESLGLSRIDLYTRFDMPLEPQEVERLRDRVQRRGRREPLAYILGTQPFRHITLHVAPGVLVPRPETELLVDLALADLPGPGSTVLDIGTGSGAIALAIASERPAAVVTATDASQDALTVAQANAARLSLTLSWAHGDLATHLPAQAWDLIIANLPYVAEDERHLCDPETAYEPALALFAGPDGLRLITALITDLPRLLRPGTGVAWLEHGHRHTAAIAALATAQGLTSTAHADHAGHERFTRLVRRP